MSNSIFIKCKDIFFQIHVENLFSVYFVVIPFESLYILWHQVYLNNLVTRDCCDITMVARCCKTITPCDPMFTMALHFKLGQLGQFSLTTSPDLKLILWCHDTIDIDTSFSVMTVTPQIPKYNHNLCCASVMVTFQGLRCTSVAVKFRSLWLHSHDLKHCINSFNIWKFLFTLIGIWQAYIASSSSEVFNRKYCSCLYRELNYFQFRVIIENQMSRNHILRSARHNYELLITVYAGTSILCVIPATGPIQAK